MTDNYSYPGNHNPNKGRITGGSVETRSPAISTPTDYGNYMPTQDTPTESSTLRRDSKPFSPPNALLSSEQLYAVVEPNTALKAEPTYTANSKYAIPKGTVVKVSKYNENYYLAEVDGRNGYICTCQVKKTFAQLTDQ
ncbi:hypothetical protein GCM10027423_49210 [Spirosoma arcticum]